LSGSQGPSNEAVASRGGAHVAVHTTEVAGIGLSAISVRSDWRFGLDSIRFRLD
jgi:hypothetical protein